MHRAELRTGRLPEPLVCERCGAVLRNRVWRRRADDSTASHASLERAQWGTCPACTQQQREEYLGRVVIDRRHLGANEQAIRRRIRNVAARAEFTQLQRRIVSIEPAGDQLEILTTSQKLAHRIVHELKKAFGGRAQYAWSDDGVLRARWAGGGGRAAGSRSG